MRTQREHWTIQFAPRANETIARLEEIDWALVFGTPAAFLDFPQRFIDLDEAPGKQQRVHGEVLGANVTVGIFALLKPLKGGQRHRSPLHDHAPYGAGRAGIEARIEFDRNFHLLARIGRRQDVGAWDGDHIPVFSAFLQVNAVKGQQFGEVAAIDYGERIKLVKVRSNVLCFDIGKSAQREVVIRIPVFFGYPGSRSLDVADRKPEPFADLS